MKRIKYYKKSKQIGFSKSQIKNKKDLRFDYINDSSKLVYKTDQETFKQAIRQIDLNKKLPF